MTLRTLETLMLNCRATLVGRLGERRFRCDMHICWLSGEAEQPNLLPDDTGGPAACNFKLRNALVQLVGTTQAPPTICLLSVLGLVPSAVNLLWGISCPRGGSEICLA